MGKDKLALKGIIEVYQNDFMCGYEGADKDELRVALLELVLEITRYQNDFRYCKKRDCPCCPEVHIRKIVNKYNAELRNLFGTWILSEVNPKLIINYLESI
ncbi:TPA: hypothetical protein QCX66_002851 [Bacillus mycoides]|uniref:hypothetical protein n=1 Tax=Bacillus sp. FSL M7-1431 TaxID=2978219 RepID=UPI0030F5849F|nr:hypothetical protein [Bacillus mycoides]